MADDKMLDDHRKTWHGFVWLIGGSAAASVLILALMAIFLT